MLLRRALELLAKNDLEWQHPSSVKVQMKRIDPSFQERPLGYGPFSLVPRYSTTGVPLIE